MAFTNPWSNIIPAGSDPANTADDEIRQLRLDIDERMDTIVGDWSADPIVALTGIRKTVHWADGSFDPLTFSTLTDGYAVNGVGLHPAQLTNTMVWRMNMHLPVGATLQEVDARVYKDNILAIMNVEIVEADDATPSEFVQATAAVGGIGGWQNLVQSGLGLVVAQDKPLLVKINFAVGIGAPLDAIRLFQVHYEYDLTSALQGITA